MDNPSDDAGDETFDLFQEPDDFYQKEKEPTQVQHRTLKGQTLNLNLVAQNPLWVIFISIFYHASFCSD